MKEYVLDANAVLRYLGISGGGGEERIKALVEQSERGSARVMMSSVNLGEVFYIMRRTVDEATTMARVQTLQQAVVIIVADAAQAIEAARLKHKYKLGYADGFAAGLALERNAILVSADPSFEHCGNSLRWVRLPPYRR